MTKEDYYKPIFAHLGEMPELNNHIEEDHGFAELHKEPATFSRGNRVIHKES